jgi:hypothetical protein
MQQAPIPTIYGRWTNYIRSKHTSSKIREEIMSLKKHLTSLALLGSALFVSACATVETVPAVIPGTQTAQVEFQNQQDRTYVLWFRRCGTSEPVSVNGDDYIIRVPAGESARTTMSTGCYFAVTGPDGLSFDITEQRINLVGGSSTPVTLSN